jgi:hypothetical protein|nr:MAG TPA: hypothetical protein [Caudoviricetes sp.]
MPEMLLKLKRILNAIPDEELKDMELWINAEVEIKVIVVEENAISLITEGKDLRINNMIW